MTPQHDLLNLIDKIGIDGIEEQGDNSPIVQETSDKQENGPSAGHFEFRPLTEEEKKEFVNSLDARGKQILAELEGRAAGCCNSRIAGCSRTCSRHRIHKTIRNRLNTTAIAA